MKINFTFFLVIIVHSLLAQQKSGALKTKNGFLLYSKAGKNSHTLNLEGDIDISNFPYIKQNKTWFQFYTAPKVEFGKEANTILKNYMNWEIEYMQQELNTKLDVKSDVSSRNGLPTNFWKFINPIIKDEKIHTSVKATYFLDFIHNDIIYRLSYAASTGNDADAQKIGFSIADNFKFYENDIDLNALQQNILHDKNDY